MSGMSRSFHKGLSKDRREVGLEAKSEKIQRTDLMLTFMIMSIYSSLTPSDICSQEGVDGYVFGEGRPPL